MAAARARRAFRYPTDSDEDEPDQGMDEQEQEQLIAELRAKDAARTTFYVKLFAILSLLCILPYTILPLSGASHPPKAHLSNVIAITSYFCNAYILYFLPAQQPATHSQGPLSRYLVYLNGILTMLLWWPAYVYWRAGDAGGWYMIAPSVVFAVVMAVRSVLVSVNIDELERLRYPYKGA